MHKRQSWEQSGEHFCALHVITYLKRTKWVSQNRNTSAYFPLGTLPVTPESISTCFLMATGFGHICPTSQLLQEGWGVPQLEHQAAKQVSPMAGELQRLLWTLCEGTCKQLSPPGWLLQAAAIMQSVTICKTCKIYPSERAIPALWQSCPQERQMLDPTCTKTLAVEP